MEWEAWALKEGLIKFQPYVEGDVRVAITDHTALTRMSIVSSSLGEQYLQLIQNSKLFTAPAKFILMLTQSQD